MVKPHLFRKHGLWFVQTGWKSDGLQQWAYNTLQEARSFAAYQWKATGNRRAPSVFACLR